MWVQKIGLETFFKACNFIKERLQHRWRTTPMAAFEVSFSIRKEFQKKKVSGEIVFALISLFYVQIQEPASRSITTRAFLSYKNLLNFIVTKYLKQEVDDDLSVCMDKHHPYVT